MARQRSRRFFRCERRVRIRDCRTNKRKEDSRKSVRLKVREEEGKAVRRLSDHSSV